MNREHLVAELDAALAAEPRPIASQRVLEIAQAKLDRIRWEHFAKWFEKNGARLMETLNGR